MNSTSKPSTSDRRFINRIGISALLVASLTVASTATGFLRETITGRTFGATSQTDSFFAAFALVSFIFFIFSGGTIQGALMPVYQSIEENTPARKCGSALLRWAGIWVTGATVGLALILYIFAEPIILLAYGGFSDETIKSTVIATRILTPIIVFSAIGSIAQTVLHSKSRFLPPAAIPVATNLLVIAALLYLAKGVGVQALSLGYLMGYSCWILILVPIALKYVNRGGEASQTARSQVKTAFLFLVSLVMVDQISGFAQRSILSGFESGLISAFTYGTRLAGLPVGILAGALTIVLFPRIVSECSTGKKSGEFHVLNLGISAIFALIVPAALFLVFEASAIVDLIYGQGAFTEEAGLNTAYVLKTYAMALPAQAFVLYFGKVLVAARESRLLLWISIIAGSVQLILSYTLAQSLGWTGVPLATFLYAYVHATLLAVGANRIARIKWSHVAKNVTRVMAALFIAALVWLIPFEEGFLFLLSRGTVFLGVYGVALLIVKEQSIFELFRNQ